MTREEAEVIAREIRNRCLHSSWSDLVAFWQGIVSNLETAYCLALQGTAMTHHMPAAHDAEPRPVVRDRLEAVLNQLVGEGRVARWRSDGMVER